MLIGFNFLTACKKEVAMPVDIASLNFNDFNAFIKKYPHSEISIASFLFANAIRIWKEQLDEEDFHALLEEVTDSILYEEVDKRILH